jgi:hypothetical protein
MTNRLHLATAALVVAAAAAPAIAADFDHAAVSIQGINIGGVSPYAYIDKLGSSSSGDSGSSNFQVTGLWAVTGVGGGDYRGGPWSTSQSADLATGVMRSSVFYTNTDGVDQYSQLGTYLDMTDYLSFHGSGTATFTMHLSGRFTGVAHASYGNTMDTALDFTSYTRGGYPDVLGRINLNHRFGDSASFAPGTTCPGVGSGSFALGTVNCTVYSLSVDGIDIEMEVQVNGITDGEVLLFRSALNVQAYGLGLGGSDFGNTARLSVVLSDGLSLSSASGAFLSQAAPVPEPGSAAMTLLGLVALGSLAARRRCRERP